MTPAQAVTILDAAMGDNWADIQPEALDIDGAIQTLEAGGWFHQLPGRYGRFRHDYIYGDDTNLELWRITEENG